MAAQTAVGFIKQGCALLHEGRMELEGAKKTAEQVIGDVKAIKGIFDWFIGLFVSKPAKPETPKPVAQKKAAAKQQSYEELELKLINDVGEQLGNFFDIQQQLQNYYLELEETSKTNYDPAQNTSKKAIERALVELQLEKLGEQIREQMTTYAPAELKAIYSRFLKMYAQIEREQEWARSETIRKTRLARWKQEQDEIRVIETISGVIAVMFISMFFGWFMWQLRSWSTGY
jgi:ABC-type phosphate transport system auxiliary subunit